MGQEQCKCYDTEECGRYLICEKCKDRGEYCPMKSVRYY